MKEPDVMDQRWACLTCSTLFRFGQVIAADVCRCPKCRSADIHPADGTVHDIVAYHGEKGTVQ